MTAWRSTSATRTARCCASRSGTPPVRWAGHRRRRPTPPPTAPTVYRPAAHGPARHREAGRLRRTSRDRSRPTPARRSRATRTRRTRRPRTGVAPAAQRIGAAADGSRQRAHPDGADRDPADGPAGPVTATWRPACSRSCGRGSPLMCRKARSRSVAPPTTTSSSPTSWRPGTTPRWCRRPRLRDRRSLTTAASTARSSTASASTRPPCTTATSSRSATSTSSSPTAR